jgi:hypothetical protein
MTDADKMVLRLPQDHPEYIRLMERVNGKVADLINQEYVERVNALIPAAEMAARAKVGNECPKHIWGRTFLAEMMRLCRKLGLRR